jgi:hypothetical protein
MTNHNKIAADEFCNTTHTSPIEAYVVNRIRELEAQVNRLKQERNDALKERDEARREVCRDEAYRPSSSPPCTANQVANRRGWDCFKQEDGK